MRKTDVCKMCDNYSTRNNCEYRKDCKLMKIIDENKVLKKQVKDMRKELDDAKLKMSYMINPNAIRRNEMGW